VGRLTFGELRWPDSADFVSVAKEWQADATTILLGFVWQGYDSFRKNVLSQIDCSQAEDQLERSITQYLTPEVRDAMTGYEPFHMEQGVYEFETRELAPSQPPLYDIAFVLRQNPRIMWPLEAKVLKTDGSVGEYVKEINNNFLTCRYAPFSSEAAMLGYLLAGNPTTAFRNIAEKAPCDMSDNVNFIERSHKISIHTRSVPQGKTYPVNFICHHLIMKMCLV